MDFTTTEAQTTTKESTTTEAQTTTVDFTTTEAQTTMEESTTTEAQATTVDFTTTEAETTTKDSTKTENVQTTTEDFTSSEAQIPSEESTTTEAKATTEGSITNDAFAELATPKFFAQIPPKKTEAKFHPVVTSRSGAVDCFQNIIQTCATALDSERYICAGKPKSDTAFFSAWNKLELALNDVYIKIDSLRIPLISDGRISSGIISTTEHINACSDYLQASWTESFVLFRGIDLCLVEPAESIIAVSESTSRMIFEVDEKGANVSLIQVSDGQLKNACMLDSELGQLEYSDFRKEKNRRS